MSQPSGSGAAHRAVIFDLGGVVLDSPLHAIARFERECGIPAGFVNRVVVATGEAGAWSRLERGELELPEFFEAFAVDCQGAGQRVDVAAMFERIGETSQPRPAMLAAIARIRAEGLRAGALTNNWPGEADGTRVLREHFDVFVESCVLGIRKPDPRIYEHACRELEISPGEAVFLDDIGRNLKAARQLGMTTIKVEAPEQALEELSAVLGFGLA